MQETLATQTPLVPIQMATSLVPVTTASVGTDSVVLTIMSVMELMDAMPMLLALISQVVIHAPVIMDSPVTDSRA